MSTGAALPPAAAADAETQLALALSALEGIACDCLDSLELARVDTDADSELLIRLLADRFRLMGAEVDAVLRTVTGRGVSDLRPWLLSPRQQELAAEVPAAPSGTS